MKYFIINRSKKSHKKKEKAVATPEVEWVPIEEMESAPTNTQSGTGRIYCTGNPFIQSIFNNLKFNPSALTNLNSIPSTFPSIASEIEAPCKCP